MPIKNLFSLSLMILALNSVCLAETQRIPVNTPGENFLTSQSSKETIQTITLTLEVRFSGSEFGIIHNLKVPQGFTVNQSLKSIYKVTNGVVCCRNTDIRCINDVCFNPSKNIFWTIGINGNYQNSSASSILNDGDHVVFTLEGDLKHESLEVFIDRLQRSRH